MSARALGPPGNGAGAHGEAGAGGNEGQREAGDTSAVRVTDLPDNAPVPPRVTRAEFVRQLLELGQRHGEIPIYGSAEWERLDPTDSRRFASVVRAAECWRREYDDPDRLARRLLDEIAAGDLTARWRVRAAGLDVRNAIDDWPRVLDVVMARREVA